ncbi:hypothetical protein EV207_12814 [Scopulibacillus darangshiensis]|uniref:Exosporium protein C n=1 Tax=Scopulibacillus darangshiensis TaxID=442528 RepID=A0A4R2NQQ5_9BACL|nr:hypothetical protein [Scopulibacillus darangshiensis]TCP23791.1 hypothetical protein EV207_12814 [Scopulibacillus darangshiensis]
MATVIDFNASVPANGSNTIFIPINAQPLKIAGFGLGITTPSNTVIIDTTVGVVNTLGNPVLLFKVLRNTQVILTVREEVQLAVGESKTVSFQSVDVDVPTGSQGYTVTVEIENGLVNSAAVSGPITHSGVALTK